MRKYFMLDCALFWEDVSFSMLKSQIIQRLTKKHKNILLILMLNLDNDTLQMRMKIINYRLFQYKQKQMYNTKFDNLNKKKLLVPTSGSHLGLEIIPPNSKILSLDKNRQPTTTQKLFHSNHKLKSQGIISNSNSKPKKDSYAFNNIKVSDSIKQTHTIPNIKASSPKDSLRESGSIRGSIRESYSLRGSELREKIMSSKRMKKEQVLKEDKLIKGSKIQTKREGKEEKLKNQKNDIIFEKIKKDENEIKFARRSINLFTQRTEFSDGNSLSNQKLGKNQSPKKILIKTRGLSQWEKDQKLQLVIASELREGKRSLTTPSKMKVPEPTSFQQEEMKKYPVFFQSQRRIHKKSDFTDEEGNPKVQRGDAIAYRYEVLNELGSGAFGRVYKVIDHKKKEQLALKIIKNVPKLNAQSRIEISILELSLEKDPEAKNNIIRIKGSFVFRGHTCIVYELLHCNLYEYIKSNGFKATPKSLMIKFSIQILQSLAFLEHHDVVHCDVKPENIMLKEPTKTGLRLIDLGSSCFQQKQFYTYIQSRFYRAPEIILGIKYTPAIDMWSFGCVLAELQRGYPIFPGKNQSDQMSMFIELLGEPPKKILLEASRRKKFFDENYQCKIPSRNKKTEKSLQKGNSSDVRRTIRSALRTEDKLLIDFVSRCLEWNPQKRIKPSEALTHHWIVEGLPANIRSRHMLEVGSQ